MGEGFCIVVWDVGIVFRMYEVYENRLLVIGGFEIDNYVCYVIGMVMVGGIDVGVWGYLYEVVGKVYWWNDFF